MKSMRLDPNKEPAISPNVISCTDKSQRMEVFSILRMNFKIAKDHVDAL